jgi:hypothetical protein
VSARGLNIFVNIGGKLLPSLNQSVKGAEAQFASMTRTMKIRAAEMKATWRSTMAAASPLLGLAAAGGLMFSAKAAIGDSAELSHELQMLRNAGRTTKDLANAMSAANRTIQMLPTTTLVDNLKVLNETTGAFGNFQHALENLTFNQRMGSMLQNMLGDKAGDPGDIFNNMVRSMEMRGVAQQAAKYQRESALAYQAMIFTRGRFNPEEFLAYSQQANPYNKGLSQRYLYKIAPSLVQEFGGERAGTMMNTFMGTLLGKAKNKMSTEAWIKLGLLDPKGVVYNKVGPVGFRPGAMKGTDLALSDPLKWSETVLIPALRAHGYDTSNQLSLAKALMPLFRDRNANRLANVLVYDQDRARLHKDERLINKVPGVDKAYSDTLRRDPLMAWQADKAAMNNLLSTVFGTSKGESPVAVALVHIANGINMVAGAFQKHPMLGQGVGALLLGSAGLAGLKVLGIGLRFILSPLTGIFKLLFLSGARKIGLVGYLFRGIAGGVRLLGPLLLRGLAALAPMVMEGLAAAFALISNPIGWGIILGAAVLALGYYFRGPLLAAWKRGWNSLISWVHSVNWRGIGMSIANALTFGLAGKFANAIANLKNSVPSANVGMNSARGGLAGARASGGPVVRGRTYLVGERGRELFTPDSSGRIIPNHHIAAMAGGPRHVRPGRGATGPLVGELHIHGAHDPHAVALEVRRQLNALANEQAAVLSD